MIETRRTTRQQADVAAAFSQLASSERPFLFDHNVNVLTKSRAVPGWANGVVSWWLIGLGMALGSVLGLWSFGGPVAAPDGFVSPGDLPRRLLTLAHIALIALPVLNLLYVSWLGRSSLRDGGLRAGCRLLLFGTITLPALLAVGALWHPALYLSPLPVSSLIAAIVVLAANVSRSPGRDP